MSSPRASRDGHHRQTGEAANLVIYGGVKGKGLIYDVDDLQYYMSIYTECRLWP